VSGAREDERIADNLGGALLFCDHERGVLLQFAAIVKAFVCSLRARLGRGAVAAVLRDALLPSVLVSVVLSVSGCDKVERTETRTAVGGLQFEERCTIRRPWLPDSPVDMKCAGALRKVDGTMLRQGIRVATLDPTGGIVAATGSRRVWGHDARTGAALGEQVLPFDWAYPHWSPDGTAFVPWGGGLSNGLYVAEVPLRGDLVVVDAGPVLSGYDWSPSGQRLAYLVNADSVAGHARIGLWVWERGSQRKVLAATRTFVSSTEMTAWAGWVNEEPHLCSDYFSEPDPACSTASRPK
jgi:hypothetical protein